MSEKRIKQILVDQYGLKVGNNIYFDGKRCMDIMVLKSKNQLKKVGKESC